MDPRPPPCMDTIAAHAAAPGPRLLGALAVAAPANGAPGSVQLRRPRPPRAGAGRHGRGPRLRPRARARPPVAGCPPRSRRLAARGDAVASLLSRRLELAADDRRARLPAVRGAGDRGRAERAPRPFLCRPTGPAGARAPPGDAVPLRSRPPDVRERLRGRALRAQAILDTDHPSFEHFAGTRQGALAVVGRFLPAGVHHILIGPDHLLFLVGLLLLGGSLRQLAVVVTAFTLAHSLTLSLAALGLVSPPARIVEPAIALSIVYVGADNLLVKRRPRHARPGSRSCSGWCTAGFASVLREMGLPRARARLVALLVQPRRGDRPAGGGAGRRLRPGRAESAQRAGPAPPGRDRFGR